MTPAELEEKTAAFQAAAVILSANHAGILAALCAEPQAPDEVARRLGLDPRAVAAVTDALVCLGVLGREGNRLKVPGDLLGAFDPSSPTSSAHAMDHQWYVLQRWANLDAVLATGQPLPRAREDEPRLRAFILGMADLARRGAGALWDAVDLSRTVRLVDVGGGPGELALAALERFPQLQATVFDLPAVLPIARDYASSRTVRTRLDFRDGDALVDDIPECDAALVSSLLHSYGPRGAAAIAGHVAAGVRPGGLVLIREFMWDDEAHSGPLQAALFAVNMLSGTAEGRCWAPGELEEIFGRAGFGGWRLTRLDPRTSLLSGTRMG
jgi:O-methyltransferase domain/DprA winged helix domain